MDTFAGRLGECCSGCLELNAGLLWLGTCPVCGGGDRLKHGGAVEVEPCAGIVGDEHEPDWILAGLVNGQVVSAEMIAGGCKRCYVLVTG